MQHTVEEFLSCFPDANSAADVTEDFLIAQLSSDERHVLWAATLLLRQMGTQRAVDALRACCRKPIRDVQITSLFALQSISGATIADFAAELLEDKQFREKWAAMVVACETCEASHRPPLERRVKAATSRPRACPEVGGLHGKTTEVLSFLQYLERTNQQLGDLRALLLKRRTKLTEAETHSIEAAR